MEVKIIPLNGCMQVFLAVMTLGVAPLMVWLNERSWPKSVDEQGLLTRGGVKIPWSDFSKITRVVTRIGNTSSTTEHFELVHPKGKVVVTVYRLENGQKILDYIWQRLPAAAKQS
ncbi:MAG: hypothetical protein IPN59_13505 [Holophaga sp.]|nr:hypothetical protein [Holophaga sp.]